MNKYTIYCTPKQTIKAIELGAPIKECGYYYKQKIGCETISDTDLHIIPTAEEMIGWLEEQGFIFSVFRYGAMVEYDSKGLIGIYEMPRKESTLAAIDAALEYLNNKSYGSNR